MKYMAIALAVVCLSCEMMAQKEYVYAPETYVAHKVEKELTIDGRASEEAWKGTSWTNEFIDIEGMEKPRYQTRAKMLWDNTYFYIYAEMEEPHVWANLKQRDTIIFYNNDFEVFVDPDGDTHNYYEMEMNALNTVWDLFLNQPYRHGNITLNDFDMNGMKTAVAVNGTLNAPSDSDQGWSVEIAIPWAVFRTSYFGVPTPVDDYWKVNFSRVNWDFEIINNAYQRKKDKNGKYLHEYNWVWSPTGVINMHEPEKWAFVFFSSKPVGSSVDFSIPDDEYIRWELNKIYRLQRKFEERNQKFATTLKELGIDKMEVNGKTIDPVLQVHNHGFDIDLISPFSQRRIHIDETGKCQIINPEKSE